MIKKYEPKYQTVVLDILSQTFGKGYIEDLEEILDREKVHALVAFEEESIIGFGYGYIADNDWLKQITPYLGGKIPPDVQDASTHSTLGVIQTVAVSPEKHGRGIGTTLVTNLEKLLWKSNCTSIIVPAWEHDKGININGIVYVNGFRYWTRIDGYWQTKCDTQEFHCPARNIRCVCKLTLYRKALSG